MATSENSRKIGLLPTPTALDGKERTYYSKGDQALGGAVKSSIYSPEASLVSLFPQQGEDEARKTTAISGRRCFESYGKHVLGSFWARTLAGSLLGTEAWYSKWCSLTWKLRATKRGRSLFQLAPSTRPIVGTEFGLLPTPRTADAEGGVVKDTQYKDGTFFRENPRTGVRFGVKTKDAIGATGLKLQPSFALWMMGYPTDWCDLKDGEMPRSRVRGMQSSPK